MELTTNNLIKIIIAVFVIVVVITGIYLGMRNYVIPYFTGIGFDENDTSIGVGGDADVCAGKEIIGTIGTGDPPRFWNNEGDKTKVYLWEDERLYEFEGTTTYFDDPIGRVRGIEIEIFDNQKEDYGYLDRALIGGREICTP
tara:strand:- start:702 stop:1127 length:426 start_codon:yes stop_codon:yes gene_type:complete